MECRVCGSTTEVQFDIKKDLVPICNVCATAIFLQQANFYASGKSIYNLPQTVKKVPKRHPEIAAQALNYLNEKLNKKHRYTVDNIPDSFLKHISARVEEGYDLMKLKAVVHSKYMEWNRDPTMKKFLRPATLFNKEKFHSYVEELPEVWNPDNSKEQRDLLRQLSNYGVRGTCNAETDTLAKKLMALGYKKKQVLNQYLIDKI